MSRDPDNLLPALAAGATPTDAEARALCEAPTAALREAAAARRDAAFGSTATFSPKVFLPLTNLCRNVCDYCAFRKSPGWDGAHTMSPDEVVAALDGARAAGCAEALFCLGDTPEAVFSGYRARLAGWGFDSTVAYLAWGAVRALERGLLPHTNAGILDADALARLKRCNVSLGLMLESASERLGERGQPHHRAPDKRPARRLAMIAEAGRQQIAFTSGILVGIGETEVERVDALLALRTLHAEHGHLQEVIVQNFRPHEGTPMASSPPPEPDAIDRAVALARLLLPPDVSVQAPPNLNPGRTAALLAAGLDDFGGISPVTPDFINPRHPWPHLDRLGDECAAAGFTLRPRAAIHRRFAERAGVLDAALVAPLEAVERRLAGWPGGAPPARAAS